MQHLKIKILDNKRLCQGDQADSAWTGGIKKPGQVWGIQNPGLAVQDGVWLQQIAEPGL